MHSYMEYDRGRLIKLYDSFFGNIGAHADLKLKFHNIEKNVIQLYLPFQKKFSDKEHVGCLHSTAITTAIDGACGFAVMVQLGKPEAIATVNLRIDHMTKPPAGKGLIVEACSYQKAGDFVYVRASVYEPNSGQQHCGAVGIFKAGSPGPALGNVD